MTTVTNPLRKALLLLAVYAVAVVAEGCDTCDPPKSFDFHGMSMTPYVIPFAGSRVEYSSDSSVLLVDRRRDSIFAFSLLADVRVLACRSGASSAPVGLLPRVYARPPCPIRGFIYWITSMDVVSDADWDAAHPAGTSLADLITLGVQQSDDRYLSKPLSKVVFDEAFHLSMITPGSPETVYGPRWIYIILRFPHPPRPGKHVFTLKVSKSNPESFEETSRPVIWN